MMEKRFEYNKGWQKTLVFQSSKPIVKFQQTHSIVDFLHFNYRPRVIKHSGWRRFKSLNPSKSNRYHLNLIH